MERTSVGERADLAEAFRGVSVTTVTPFRADSLDLDLAGLRGNLRFLAGSGVAVIVPGGNTGEYHNLTVEELRAVTETAIQVVAGESAVITGVGGDVRTAIALARFAQEAGAHGLLLHEPAHTFASEEGLYRYYREICRAIEIGVAIYKRSPRLDDALLVRIARDCPNVVAIKYAWNDVASFVRLQTEMPARVTCVCGSAERWALPFSVAGTTGFTSGIANFAPELALRYWRALGTDPSAAKSLWKQISPLEEVRARMAAAFNVPVIKFAMDLVGLAAGPPRPPLAPLSEEVEAEIRQILQGWDVPIQGASQYA